MTELRTANVIASGFTFAESPRWHDGAFWFSDFHDGCVCRLGPDNKVSKIVEVPGEPSGLGWLPSGDMLVVSMQYRQLMKFDGNSLTQYADLSHIATWHCNDMAVDKAGNAYVGNFGAAWDPEKPPVPTKLACVRPDRSVIVAAADLIFPNGMVISDDSKTLYVAETRANRISVFDIQKDGSLANQKIWAEVESGPDGMCLDAEGMLWVALPMSGEVQRISAGGKVHYRVKPTADMPVACMLGGPDRHHLYITTSFNGTPEQMVSQRRSRIESIEVPAVRVGRP